jgi:hypothetical protein
MQYGPERRVYVAEFNAHSESASGMRHRRVAVEKFCLRANFHDDYRTLGKWVGQGEVRSKDAQIFDTGWPHVR